MEDRKGANQDLLSSGRLLTAAEVMFLGCIKSQTTLISMERNGEIRVARRIGNQKRYSPTHIRKVLGL